MRISFSSICHFTDTTPKPTHFDSDSGGSDNEDDNAFEEDLYLSPVLRSPASSFCGSKDEFFSEQRVILVIILFSFPN